MSLVSHARGSGFKSSQPTFLVGQLAVHERYQQAALRHNLCTILFWQASQAKSAFLNIASCLHCVLGNFWYWLSKICPLCTISVC